MITKGIISIKYNQICQFGIFLEWTPDAKWLTTVDRGYSLIWTRFSFKLMTPKWSKLSQKWPFYGLSNSHFEIGQNLIRMEPIDLPVNG